MCVCAHAHTLVGDSAVTHSKERVDVLRGRGAAHVGPNWKVKSSKLLLGLWIILIPARAEPLSCVHWASGWRVPLSAPSHTCLLFLLCCRLLTGAPSVVWELPPAPVEEGKEEAGILAASLPGHCLLGMDLRDRIQG